MDTVFIEKDNELIKIDKDTNICIFNQALKNINIKILDNIKVTINDFNINSSDITNININIGSNSTLIYNKSNIVNEQHKLNFEINYEGNNSKVITKIHSIVYGYESIKINGIIKNEHKDNELLEQVKIMLIDEGICDVIPNIIIGTNAVIANHKVAISNIRENELFYLMSKGLKEHSAKELIKKSFLISNIKNNDLIKKINENL